MNAEIVQRVFEYHPDGYLIWKIKPSQDTEIGTIAGSNHLAGYRKISFQNCDYQEHRLVWLFHKGKWPDKTIDHINGKKSDNRIENLRDVSHQENMRAYYQRKRETAK